MAKYKVSIPENVEEQLDLATRVAARHALDGASSILNNLQDYSWNGLAATIPTCLAHHRDAENLRRQMIEAYQMRDQQFPTFVKAVRATRDYLLGVFRATPARLGDWGFDVTMPNGRPRVAIPDNVEQLLTLAGLIAQKHAADGASSVLNGLSDFNWTTLAPTIAICLTKHQEAESLKFNTDEAYQLRNQLLPPIVNALKATRDLLLGAYANTPTRLGDWGFDVSQATRKPKPQPTA